MDKNQAIEKINKLLALATNKGATKEEAKNAMAMAEKIASKYGLRIEKKEKVNTTQVKEKIIPHWIHVPSYKRFILEAMMEAVGIWATFDNKEKVVKFWAPESFNEIKFIQLYRKYRSEYRKDYKIEKEEVWFDSRAFNKTFKEYVYMDMKRKWGSN